jgi:arabinose-5-phosphate isomerase
MRTPLSPFLQQEADAIYAAAQRLAPSQVEEALRLLECCAVDRGKLIISGVGKSGIIARKLAATFTSVGLAALYLNPVDALHGDLGVVTRGDVAILISNSGQTEELCLILPHLQRRQVPSIGLLGNIRSRLAGECQAVLDASIEREVCPLNLAPTASTAVAMAIGDALAAVWMSRRGVSSEQFALNHPAGALGKRLTLTVTELMVPTDQLEPLEPHDPLAAVVTHITRGGIGSCWIESSEQPGQLAGLITDGDLRRALQRHSPEQWSELSAGQLMTVDPITLPADTLAIDALQLMEHNRRGSAISVIPIVDSQPRVDATSATTAPPTAVHGRSHGPRLLGLLRLHDLVQAGLAAGSNGRAKFASQPDAQYFPRPTRKAA